jgi:hypothetical protein
MQHLEGSASDSLCVHDQSGSELCDSELCDCELRLDGYIWFVLA